MSEILEALKLSLNDPNLSFLEEFLRKLGPERRVWIAGNGGSASTAVHFASDLRNLGYDVVCMDENISRITAITNDYGWNQVYNKQMKHFHADDILIVISVHGGTQMPDDKLHKAAEVWSSNLVAACRFAKEQEGVVLALLGGNGGAIKRIADVSLIVPNNLAYVVEGIHCVLTHLICERLTMNK